MEPRCSISDEGREGSRHSKKKGGYISVFLVIAVLALLLVSGNLLREQMRLKMVSRGYERVLKFDYHLEGYYLLIRTGSLLPEEGLRYGRLDTYVLEGTYEGKDYIEVLSDSSRVRVRGYYGEVLRQEYNITR